ncbi:expressed unknown protein [Seminavis robusta]|uniref:JmjC domain-containing protein n=1 Tax=Seminavis robusta TaxID=568900 RepID=A0A9N8DDT8_9STRA|nr:expressed unknown protein [Seminavis robusta]|eukprot:Sro27_g017980.1 n/a (428) ;mRNA; f:1655-2938
MNSQDKECLQQGTPSKQVRAQAPAVITPSTSSSSSSQESSKDGALKESNGRIICKKESNRRHGKNENPRSKRSLNFAPSSSAEDHPSIVVDGTKMLRMMGSTSSVATKGSSTSRKRKNDDGQSPISKVAKTQVKNVVSPEPVANDIDEMSSHQNQQDIIHDLRKENKRLQELLKKEQNKRNESQQLLQQVVNEQQQEQPRFGTRSSRKQTHQFAIKDVDYDRWLDVEVPTKCCRGRATRCVMWKKLATLIKNAFRDEGVGKKKLLKRAVITMDPDTGYGKAVLSDDFIIDHQLKDVLPDGVELTSMKIATDAVEAFCNEQANTGSTHDDDLVGFLLVLRGRKIARMAKPQKVLKTLGKALTRVDGCSSKDTASFYKEEAFGDHATAEIWKEVVLNPGEGIIIPRRWIHAFKSDPDTVALSFKLKRLC